MNDWFQKYPFRDYRTACEHLAKRSPRVRDDAPLVHAVRLVRHCVDKHSVSVVYHKTPIVTFFENGNQALHWGGWYTKTTFEHIERYAQLGDLRISVHKRDRHGRGEGVEWYLARHDWPRTPSRVTHCRRCKGTGTTEQHLAWEQDEGGVVLTRRCFHCNASGEIERGNKIVPEVSDGDVLVILPPVAGAPTRVAVESDAEDWMPTYTCACSLCQCGCNSWTSHWSHTQTVKQYSYKPSISASYKPTHSPHDMGSEVADELARLLPGLDSLTPCPRCSGHKETNTRSVRGQIVHLNDKHRATREEIADWLDALDVDLRFPVPAFS